MNGSLQNVREVPELQGQGSGQVVVVQVPARGAPAWDHGRDGDASGGWRVHLFPRCHPPSLPYATAPRRGGASCGGAHSSLRLVSSPSCEGTVPVRSLSLRRLREGGGAGSHGRDGDASGGRRASSRSSPTPALVPRLGGGEGGELRRRSQSRQIGEQPELRGDVAGQVVAAKEPARGAPG